MNKGLRRIALLIPVFNGGSVITEVIGRCRMHDLPVIVVDDGSTDGTLERVARLEVDQLVRQESNRGKGFALRSGFESARRAGYEAVVTLDADGQHRPEEVPKFLDCYDRTDADIIVGDRFGDREYLKRMPWQRVLSNRISSALIRTLCRLPIRDVQCGFRLYRLASVGSLASVAEGFEYETEVLLQARARNLRLENIPVRCEYPQGTVRSQYRAVFHSWQIARVVLAQRRKTQGGASGGNNKENRQEGS